MNLIKKYFSTIVYIITLIASVAVYTALIRSDITILQGTTLQHERKLDESGAKISRHDTDIEVLKNKIDNIIIGINDIKVMMREKRQ